MQQDRDQQIAVAAFYGQEGIYEQKNIDPSRKRKVLDNIHGFISFPQKIWNFIDTPEFQRLRNIKQLGTLFYVFPGAIHSRFEHSIGTGYLAQKYVKILIENHKQLYQVKNQKDQVDLQKTKINQEQAIFTVTLAGVMHDIGHGPYSHTFDGTVIGNKWEPCKQLNKWKHEYASKKIFENLGVQILPHLKDRVIALINGRKQESFDLSLRPWQFELINNQLTGIDVDKMDYFRRDAFYLGAKNIYIDNDLLMEESKILKGEKGYRIAYPSKYYHKVMDIYHSRYKLYQAYYYNKVSLGIQSMICGILQKMQDHPKFKLLDKCKRVMNNDISGYVQLNDNIIDKVDQIQPQDVKDKAMKKNILDAKELLKRIRIRDIYRFVKSTRASFNHNIYQQKGIDPKIDEQNTKIEEIYDKARIKQYIIKNSNGMLKPEDVFVVQGDITFGMKNKNPLNQIKFFHKGEDEIIDIKPHQFTLLETKGFIQKHIDIYLTVDDEIKFKQLKKAFDKYIQDKKLNPGVSKVSTPRPYSTRSPIQQPDRGEQLGRGRPEPLLNDTRRQNQGSLQQNNRQGRKRRHRDQSN